MHCEPAGESAGRGYPYTMPRSFHLARRWLLALPAALLAAGCGGPADETDSAQDVEERLVGTWLREYAEDGARIRRVLVLEPGGHFREMSRADGADAAADHVHAGEWRFDGINLKRRYTSIDGKRPAAPAMPYATFELKFRTHNEFTGIDHVRRREVQYARVADGTLP